MILLYFYLPSSITSLQITAASLSLIASMLTVAIIIYNRLLKSSSSSTFTLYFSNAIAHALYSISTIIPNDTQQTCVLQGFLSTFSLLLCGGFLLSISYSRLLSNTLNTNNCHVAAFFDSSTAFKYTPSMLLTSILISVVLSIIALAIPSSSSSSSSSTTTTTSFATTSVGCQIGRTQVLDDAIISPFSSSGLVLRFALVLIPHTTALVMTLFFDYKMSSASSWSCRLLVGSSLSSLSSRVRDRLLLRSRIALCSIAAVRATAIVHAIAEAATTKQIPFFVYADAYLSPLLGLLSFYYFCSHAVVHRIVADALIIGDNTRTSSSSAATSVTAATTTTTTTKAGRASATYTILSPLQEQQQRHHEQQASDQNEEHSQPPRFRVFIGTWNLGNKAPRHEDLTDWLQQQQQQRQEQKKNKKKKNEKQKQRGDEGDDVDDDDDDTSFDILAIGSQECNYKTPVHTLADIDHDEPISPTSSLLSHNATSSSPSSPSSSSSSSSSPSSCSTHWTRSLHSALHSLPHPSSSSLSSSSSSSSTSVTSLPAFTHQYTHVASSSVGHVRLSVYVHRRHRHRVSRVRIVTEAFGIVRVFTNKGAVVVTMCLGDTELCFATCHLAAHAKKKYRKRRVEDVNQIFGRLPHLLGFDPLLRCHYTFLFGDLNFRWSLNVPSLTRTMVNEMIDRRAWSQLSEVDELNEVRARNEALTVFKEAPVLYPPTYKYLKPGKKNKTKKTHGMISSSSSDSHSISSGSDRQYLRQNLDLVTINDDDADDDNDHDSVNLDPVSKSGVSANNNTVLPASSSSSSSSPSYEMLSQQYTASRTPAWTDRILYFHRNMDDTNNNSSNSNNNNNNNNVDNPLSVDVVSYEDVHHVSTSDHKPIRGEFLVRPVSLSANVNVSDNKRVSNNADSSVFLLSFTEIRLLDCVGARRSRLLQPYITFHSLALNRAHATPVSMQTYEGADSVACVALWNSDLPTLRINLLSNAESAFSTSPSSPSRSPSSASSSSASSSSSSSSCFSVVPLEMSIFDHGYPLDVDAVGYALANIDIDIGIDDGRDLILDVPVRLVTTNNGRLRAKYFIKRA